jgi:phage-related protein
MKRALRREQTKDKVMSEEVAEAINNAFNTQYGTLIDAIVDSFQRGGEDGDLNLVGVINNLSDSAKTIAKAIVPPVHGSKDASGCYVESLTEAVMGVTGGLCNIAEAIENLADAVRSLPG